MEINILIAVIVIGARLIAPLFIPRFPLPAIIACLLIDGIDQTIFQKFTTINLDGYQSYDKALDIYYLSIAYLSTFKNWQNQAAFRISQFLFYYRIVGVMLFEFTQIRAVLFIFPNTFEYFFIFYSAVALFWNTKRMTTKFLIGAAAFIWIFIKLPQEYWIHIAQLDTTDFIKETILGVPVTTAWSDAISQNMWVIPVLGIAALITGIIIWQVIKRLPKPDHKIKLAPEVKPIDLGKYMEVPKGFINLLRKHKVEFFEKIVMVGLISLIFAQMFPSLRGANFEVAFGVTTVIIINAVLGYLLIQKSKLASASSAKFFPMFVINLIVIFVYTGIVTKGSDSISLLLVLFFAYIITLLTVFYDRFRPYYLDRFERS